MAAGKTKARRDAKHRVLRRGESIRADGKYQFKYHINGKPYFVYSWSQPISCLRARSRACRCGSWKSRSDMTSIHYLTRSGRT